MTSAHPEGLVVPDGAVSAVSVQPAVPVEVVPVAVVPLPLVDEDVDPPLPVLPLEQPADMSAQRAGVVRTAAIDRAFLILEGVAHFRLPAKPREDATMAGA